MCITDVCKIYLIAELIIIFIVDFRLSIWLDGKYAEIIHDYEGLSVCVYMYPFQSIYGMYIYICLCMSV